MKMHCVHCQGERKFFFHQGWRVCQQCQRKYRGPPLPPAFDHAAQAKKLWHCLHCDAQYRFIDEACEHAKSLAHRLRKPQGAAQIGEVRDFTVASRRGGPA